MPLLHIIILALVQGITEFLPISSSGHLLLVHDFIGDEIAAQNLMIDIAVHVGTLLAVLLYFRRDVLGILNGCKNAIKGKRKNPDSALGVYVLLGSLPVIVAGAALSVWQPAWLRGTEVVAWTTLIFGVLLWAVDAYVPGKRTLPDMNWKRALFIGGAQVLALIPGTSRSGITMTAARYLGFTRAEAARFSLLLAIIAISGAGAIGGLMLLESGDMNFGIDVLLAAGLAFISGYIAISLMMSWLQKASFTPFAIYRIVLGLALLAMIYWP